MNSINYDVKLVNRTKKDKVWLNLFHEKKIFQLAVKEGVTNEVGYITRGIPPFF